jgi:hypothetical protein
MLKNKATRFASSICVCTVFLNKKNPLKYAGEKACIGNLLEPAAVLPCREDDSA